MPVERHLTPAICQLCGRSAKQARLVPAAVVGPFVTKRIAQDYPSWSPDGFICVDDLNRFRSDYVRSLLQDEKGELTSLERSVVESVARQETLSEDIETEFQKKLTIGETLADRIADFGGSWTFILSFGGFILVWVVINTIVLIARPFDPYPFILLNLVLSFQAAYTGPVVMMSQNRQAAKDRDEAEHDYGVNEEALERLKRLEANAEDILRRLDGR
jgi:uncharacterized membrane protein